MGTHRLHRRSAICSGDALNGLPHEGLGNLRVDEVFLRFDGPRLFTAVNEGGQHYLGLFVEETDDAEVFIYAPVSPDRLAAARAGAIPLRVAFTEPQDGHVFVVFASTESADQILESRTPESIPERWLPDADAALTVPASNSEKFEPEKLAIQANAEGRTLAAVRLHAPWARTEYPARRLGEFLRIVQDNLDALAQEALGTPTASGQVPAELVEDVELAFAGSAAASYVIVLAAPTESKLFEPPALRLAFDRLVSLVAASADSADKLEGELAGLHSRALTHYKELLTKLEDVNSGLGVFVATPKKALAEASLTLDQVKTTLGLVKETTSTVTAIDLDVTGTLVGVNTRTQRFELRDDDGVKYAGWVIENAKAEVFGVTTGYRYKASIKEETEVPHGGGDPKIRHYLWHIEPDVPFAEFQQSDEDA